jgi:hypothetical protein
VLGLPPSRLRDGGLYGPHRPSSLRSEEKAFRFHFGEPSNSKTTVWVEGIAKLYKSIGWVILIGVLRVLDHVHFHPHPLH